MTCRRPTISVRMDVLKRLAQAAAAKNADGVPDSLEYEAVELEELERTSLVDGLSEILAYEEDRITEESAEQLARLEALEEKRRRKVADAEAWERAMMLQKRAEQMNARIEEEKLRVRLVIEEELRQSDEETRRRHAMRQTEYNLALDVASIQAERKKRTLKRTVMSLTAAAAVFAGAFTMTFWDAQKDHRTTVADLRNEATDVAMAARTRVAELEAEIARSAHLAGEQKDLLEGQLADAKAELAAADAEQEKLEIDRRNKNTVPRRLAAQAPAPRSVPSAPSPRAAEDGSSVKVASDVVPENTCAAFDPMCFEL